MARTARRSESGKRDASSKLAEHRFSVLEVARELGRVTEAGPCRRLDRTSRPALNLALIGSLRERGSTSGI